MQSSLLKGVLGDGVMISQPSAAGMSGKKNDYRMFFLTVFRQKQTGSHREIFPGLDQEFFHCVIGEIHCSGRTAFDRADGIDSGKGAADFFAGSLDKTQSIFPGFCTFNGTGCGCKISPGAFKVVILEHFAFAGLFHQHPGGERTAAEDQQCSCRAEKVLHCFYPLIINV